MSALDDLLGEFESNAGTMPQVNPPEAAAVLEEKTAPEVAGASVFLDWKTTAPAPTEKPAEVKAAEQAKTRKPRGSKATPAAPAAPPEGWDNAPAPGADGKLTTEQLVAELRDRGYNVTLTVGR